MNICFKILLEEFEKNRQLLNTEITVYERYDFVQLQSNKPLNKLSLQFELNENSTIYSESFGLLSIGEQG